jgi:hypothetical protein
VCAVPKKYEKCHFHVRIYKHYYAVQTKNIFLILKFVGKLKGAFKNIGNHRHVRFQVLTAASMKFRVFWDVPPCSQVDIDRRFSGASIIRTMNALMMEAVSTS